MKQYLLSQLGRFARLAGAAFIASGVVPQIVHGGASRQVVVAAAVGAVEVAYRTLRPTIATSAAAKQAERAVLAHLAASVAHVLNRHGGLSVSTEQVEEGLGSAAAGLAELLPAAPVVDPPPAPAAVPVPVDAAPVAPAPSAPVEVTSVTSTPAPAAPPSEVPATTPAAPTP